MPEMSKGFTCVCGKEVEYPAYVFAHWSVPLIHTCECGKTHEILQGKAVLIEE